jgi:two-component system sensor histidine kinase MprB
VSFHRRLTLLVATSVALAIVLAAAVSYLVVRTELRHEQASTLRANAATYTTAAVRIRKASRSATGFAVLVDRRRIATGTALAQVLARDGRLAVPLGQDALPVSPQLRSVAAGRGGGGFADATIGGAPARTFVTAINSGLALEVAIPTDGDARTLSRIRRLLALAALAGALAAAALGALVARSALRPVRQLTFDAEHIAETRDLAHRVDASDPDELGRLAGSFNTMLEALERSTDAQRRLIGDASHELRTPLTSMRTNVELLASGAPGLEESERGSLLAAVEGQLTELTALVSSLVELAAEPPRPEERAPVALDAIVEEAVARARRVAPGLELRLAATPTTVVGVAQRLERAVASLLDNAVKWSPPGGSIEVSVADGAVAVSDRGPGIDPADAARAFDRFFRASSARSLPGSGLGLALVRQVAEEHGGSASLEPRPGGGTTARFAVPAVPASGIT